VVKDRLYTCRASDPSRRAIQTVMRRTLSALARLMAPILSFTAEEIWLRLAPGEGASVFLEEYPEAPAEWLAPEIAAEMDRLLDLRAKANKSLEEARRDKIIGSSLEAEVALAASGADLEVLRRHEGELAELLIVSRASVSEGPPDAPLSAAVSASPHPKCPRCWVRHPEVPADGGGVCPKCRLALG
jgi:isoleucyl-tRNA synthetase